MDEKEARHINTVLLRPEYVKNVTHYLCGKVIETGKKHGISDVYNAFEIMCGALIRYSDAYAPLSGIKPIRRSDDVLECFFNQKNELPGYIIYWLESSSAEPWEHIRGYCERHYEVCDKLRKEYISKYRWWKNDKKETRQIEARLRRKICKMYRSGEYNALFELRNTNLSEILERKEIEDLSLLLVWTFGNSFSELHDSDEECAAAFMLGRIQGRRDAESQLIAGKEDNA